jgi:methylenetetrahydrofolate dehydrogenase (NADP+)/methenyltetrahydrofolate cyclohydrolase
MIVNGKTLAEEIHNRTHERVKMLERAPVLTIITCSPNPETKRYLALKQKQTARIGIHTEVVEISPESTTTDVLGAIQTATKTSDAILVQFPVPSGIDKDTVVKNIPLTHDADVLNPDNTTLPSPVVGAIQEILKAYVIDPKGKFVTVIGSGRLVGLPAAAWFQSVGAYVSVVTKDTVDIAHYTKNADIIVCGAGVPNLLTKDMVKEGVIILDAGTTEDSGELRGDADPLCAQKASLFTPVPGGIGPLTIAVLLRNVALLAESKKPMV